MKKVTLITLLLLAGCTKPELPTPEPPVEKIFNVGESNVVDNQSIYFELPSAGTYFLVLIDKKTGQVISREKFTGQIGENVKKIYTKSIQVRYLYLVLEDGDKTELKKTTIILK
jgi:hypothetical protein